MLFVKRSNTALWIPRHKNGDGPYKLTITHNMTGSETVLDDLQNEGYKSGYWIFIGLDLRSLEGGECTYRVYDKDNNELETGLLQVMQELSEPISISYKKETNKIVYNGQ